jgi:phage/plasmid-associated DNA primase
LCIVGHTASNGKSTLVKMFSTCFSIYCRKIDSRTFSFDYTKAHKQFADIKQPVRFIYAEELDRKRLDNRLLKDFVDGDKIGGNEVLYGTTEDIELQCKLTVVSNNDPVFDNDEGIRRRGLLEILTNKFIDEADYDKLDNKKGTYVVDRNLINELKENDAYKIEFFNLLLPYAIKYYKDGLIIPKIVKDGFDNLCIDNDQMAQFIDANFEQTNHNNDKVSKEEFLKLYNVHYNTKLRWNVLMSDVKRLLTYDRNRYVNGQRGVIVGLKLKDNGELWNDGSECDALDEL